jgi:hypothetical protein
MGYLIGATEMEGFGIIMVLGLIALSIIIPLLPMIIAINRRHRRSGAIAILNLLNAFGGTVLFFIVPTVTVLLFVVWIMLIAVICKHCHSSFAAAVPVPAHA